MSNSGKQYLYSTIGKEMNCQLYSFLDFSFIRSFVTENPYLEQDSSSIQLKSFVLPDGQTVGISFSYLEL